MILAPFPLPNTPDQLPQIATLNPRITRRAARRSSTGRGAANTTTSLNAPSLAELSDDAGRPTADDGIAGDDHVGGDDAVGQDLDVFADEAEGLKDRVGADVDMRADASSADAAVRADEDVVADLHGVVREQAARDARRRPDRAVGADDGAAADADGVGVLRGRRRR